MNLNDLEKKLDLAIKVLENNSDKKDEKRYELLENIIKETQDYLLTGNYLEDSNKELMKELQVCIDRFKKDRLIILILIILFGLLVVGGVFYITYANILGGKPGGSSNICLVNCDENHDGKLDYNIDYGNNKKPTFNVKNSDGSLRNKVDQDTNHDNICDLNCDTNNDGRPDINIDLDNDGKPDLNLDINRDEIPDINIDDNSDGTPDRNLMNQDTDGDDEPDLNVDSDNDGWPDINIDVDGDGESDINIDTDNDGKPDKNVDTNKDMVCDVNCYNDNNICTKNCDVNHDNVCDLNCYNDANVCYKNCDINLDGVCDSLCDADANLKPTTTTKRPHKTTKTTTTTTKRVVSNNDKSESGFVTVIFDNSNLMDLNNLYPVDDPVGLKSKPVTWSLSSNLTNSSKNYVVTYAINLKDDISNIPKNELLDISHLKFQLLVKNKGKVVYNSNTQLLKDYPEVQTGYRPIIVGQTFKKDEKLDFELRMWVESSTDNSQQAKRYRFNIDIESTYDFID